MARTHYENLGMTNTYALTAEQADELAKQYARARARWQEAEGRLDGCIAAIKAKAFAGAPSS